MTQSFDEWFEKQGMADCYGKSSEEYKVSLFVWTRQQAEIDELRKRIDLSIESLKLVNHALLYEHIDHIINLLDGTTNEQ